MLMANIWTESGLVNGAMETVQDILFKEQGPLSLLIAVFIKFDIYEGPTINTLKGDKVIPIVAIRRTWKGKKGTLCSQLQLLLCLAWAITVHKSQGLTLPKAKIDFRNREFAAGLLFIAISRVRSFNNIYFKAFSLNRLQCIKSSKRLNERIKEEERLHTLIP